MTREDIHEKIHFGDRLDYRSFNELHETIEEIFDYFEEDEPILNNYTFTSCDDCKHLENREESLKHNCLSEVCRTCSRNNRDNWEKK